MRNETERAHADRMMAAHLEALLENEGYPVEERRGLARLMGLFATLPPPPDPYGLFPRYSELREKFLEAAAGSDGRVLEEGFLALYCHVHGYEVPYTPEERIRFEASRGYLCHVGGLSPILKAGPFIQRDTVSGDFGAGNGLQGLLLQVLHPHRKTLQIEISSRMVETGKYLQGWLGIPVESVEWIVGDVSSVSPATMDFVYLYLPVRPTGAGRRFYENFAAELERAPLSVVIFSIADCLKSFLSDGFETFYSDGHLTCFRRRRGT